MVESNSDEPTLLNWIEDQIPKLNIKEGTKKHYHTLPNSMKEYNQLRRWQDVPLKVL